MDRPKLVGDIVTHWHKYGERRKTVAFAVNVAHSVHLRDEFVKSGVRAEHIDGGTPKLERDATLARLASGEIELVTNCMVLTEGWDMPEVGACILARPTRKMGLYRQMIGRVLRPAEGKPDAIILDHSGAVFRHGFAEDPVEWTLDPDRRATSPTHQQRERHARSRLIECSQCGAIRDSRLAVWDLWVSSAAAAAPGVVTSTAISAWSITRATPTAISTIRPCARALARDARLDRRRTRLQAAAGWRTNTRKNSAPSRLGATTPEPIPPTPEVRSWVRSRQIAFARSRVA